MANRERPKAGQPTLYKPEYVQEFLDYFDVEPYREVMKKIHTKQGDVIEIPENESNDFPSLSGFAVKIGVHRDTLLEWSKVHPEFGAVYSRAKDFQENFILVNGNKSLIHPQFGMFTAKNVLGYRDKQPDEVDVIVNNNNQFQKMSDEELASKERELLKKHGLLKDEE
jgi:hypothetical protein